MEIRFKFYYYKLQENIEQTLAKQFMKAFQELFNYQQIHDSQTQMPLIIQTCLPNTFILHLSSREKIIQGIAPEQGDLLQRFPYLLIPPQIAPSNFNHPILEQFQKQDHLTHLNTNEMKLEQNHDFIQSRKKSPINDQINMHDQQFMEEKSQHHSPQQSPINQFKNDLHSLQISAQQIQSLTPSQLVFMLDRIQSDQLDESQKQYLLRIKQTLNTASPVKKTIQSDTKNIPKNFTKAMFSYAMFNEGFVNVVLDKLMLSNKKEQFIEWLKLNKKDIHNIKQLKQLNSEDHEFVLPFKLIQKHFLNYNAPCYIFNSRIGNTPAHLKVRQHIKKQLFYEQNEK